MDSSQNNQQAQKPESNTSVGDKMHDMREDVNEKFLAQGSHGPVLHENLNVKEEGTKEERRAKAQEMNKE